MGMTRDNNLKAMVKTESTKFSNWLAFENSSLLPSSKSHNLII